MHESPRTPCRYQLCVRIYACTTSTAFTLAPCWHQIRMHHINSLHFCAFASAFNNCKPNSSAKISKKRSKTFHLAVKGIQHTSRWLKLERRRRVHRGGSPLPMNPPRSFKFRFMRARCVRPRFRDRSRPCFIACTCDVDSTFKDLIVA